MQLSHRSHSGGHDGTRISAYALGNKIRHRAAPVDPSWPAKSLPLPRSSVKNDTPWTLYFG